MSPLFMVTRVVGDTAILRGTKEGRLATISPHDTSLPGDKDEAAALATAKISAEALNKEA